VLVFTTWTLIKLPAVEDADCISTYEGSELVAETKTLSPVPLRTDAPPEGVQLRKVEVVVAKFPVDAGKVAAAMEADAVTQ